MGLLDQVCAQGCSRSCLGVFLHALGSGVDGRLGCRMLPGRGRRRSSMRIACCIPNLSACPLPPPPLRLQVAVLEHPVSHLLGPRRPVQTGPERERWRAAWVQSRRRAATMGYPSPAASKVFSAITPPCPSHHIPCRFDPGTARRERGAPGDRPAPHLPLAQAGPVAGFPGDHRGNQREAGRRTRRPGVGALPVRRQLAGLPSDRCIRCPDPGALCLDAASPWDAVAPEPALQWRLCGACTATPDPRTLGLTNSPFPPASHRAAGLLVGQAISIVLIILYLLLYLYATRRSLQQLSRFSYNRFRVGNRLIRIQVSRAERASDLGREVEGAMPPHPVTCKPPRCMCYAISLINCCWALTPAKTMLIESPCPWPHGPPLPSPRVDPAACPGSVRLPALLHLVRVSGSQGNNAGTLVFLAAVCPVLWRLSGPGACSSCFDGSQPSPFSASDPAGVPLAPDTPGCLTPHTTPPRPAQAAAVQLVCVVLGLLAWIPAHAGQRTPLQSLPTSHPSPQACNR